MLFPDVLTTEYTLGMRWADVDGLTVIRKAFRNIPEA